MKNTFYELNYSYDSLEPHIDSKTLEIHYSKHHQNYFNKFTEALDKYPELQEKSVEDILKDIDNVPEDIRDAVRNNGGGHYNHSFYWSVMQPGGPNRPSDDFANKIGGYEKFKDEFSHKSLSLFGSGWVWLVENQLGEFEIVQTKNQDCPLSVGKMPLLTIDLWEHAYYLKYQNRRAEYIDAWWSLINWDVVEKLYQNRP